MSVRTAYYNGSNGITVLVEQEGRNAGKNYHYLSILGGSDDDLLDIINKALRNEDVEGLIADGAPEDEYESEAKYVAEAMAVLTLDQLTESNIVAILSLVWAKMFNLGPEELALRVPALQIVARNILQPA